MLREVQLLGLVRHEALLPLLGFCLDQRGMCLVYPLCVGGNLEDRLLLTAEGQQRLARLGHAVTPAPLTWLQRLRIMQQAIGALLYLHTPTAGKGVELHNDVKPSNILLDEQLNAKLGDVGLGLVVDGSEQGRTHVSLNGVFGTTGFIDPLLSDTQRCSPVTDGYAIGIAMLMCLTGLPALDIKARCRRLLCRPDEPAEWEAPGLPDTAAGAWPGRVTRLVAKIISGLVMPQFKEDRLPLAEASRLLVDALSTAPVDSRPAAPARIGPLETGLDAEQRECVICTCEPREVRFSCGHAVCCRGCAESLLALGHPCPTCRTSNITSADVSHADRLQPTYVKPRQPTLPRHTFQLPSLPPSLGRGWGLPAGLGGVGIEWSGVNWGAPRHVGHEPPPPSLSPSLPPARPPARPPALPPALTQASESAAVVAAAVGAAALAGATPGVADPTAAGMHASASEAERPASPRPLQPLPASWIPTASAAHVMDGELEAAPLTASPPLSSTSPQTPAAAGADSQPGGGRGGRRRSKTYQQQHRSRRAGQP